MAKSSIVNFVGEGVEEITIGAFIVRRLKDGSFWLEADSGEGMQVQEDMLEETIGQFFVENF